MQQGFYPLTLLLFFLNKKAWSKNPSDIRKIIRTEIFSGCFRINPQKKREARTEVQEKNLA